MSQFYLFWPATVTDDVEDYEWVQQDGQSLRYGRGTLADMAKLLQQHELTVLLRGEDVLFLQVTVPGRNLQHVRQAVPYALEEQLIDDVEQLHFAVQKSRDTHSTHYDVLVINHQLLESIMQALQVAGIAAKTVTADYLLLPESVLLATPHRMLFNTEKLRGAAALPNSLQVQDLSDDNERLRVVVCDSADVSALRQQLSGIQLEEKHCDNNWALCLVENQSSSSPLNLLQGRFQMKKNGSAASARWLPAAAVLVLWLLVQGGLWVSDYLQLQQQDAALKAEIVALYKQAFPQARRVVAPRRQMEQKLQQLRQRSGIAANSFSALLTGSATIMKDTAALQLRSLRYYAGQMNLEIQLANLQALEQLKQRLETEKGYRVEIQSVASGKQFVTARLQIQGGEK